MNKDNIILSTFSNYYTRFNIYASITSIMLKNISILKNIFTLDLNIELIIIYKDGIDIEKIKDELNNSQISYYSFTDFIKYFNKNQNELNLKEFKDWLNIKFFVFIDLSWHKIVCKLGKNNINITSGYKSNKYILTPNQFRLSYLCYLLKITDQLILESFLLNDSLSTLKKRKKKKKN